MNGGYTMGGIGAPPLAATDGVIGRRFGAYLVDLLAISVLCTLMAIAIGFAGIITFGLTWMLYGILVPATAIGYAAFTLGGPWRSTWGMRLFGLVALDATTGGPVGPLTAAVHALLFYLGAGTLLLILDVLIGLARSDSRLGHDLLTGVVLVRARAFG